MHFLTAENFKNVGISIAIDSQTAFRVFNLITHVSLKQFMYFFPITIETNHDGYTIEFDSSINDVFFVFYLRAARIYPIIFATRFPVCHARS